MKREDLPAVTELVREIDDIQLVVGFLEGKETVKIATENMLETGIVDYELVQKVRACLIGHKEILTERLLQY